jgi:hypothetical protein
LRFAKMVDIVDGDQESKEWVGPNTREHCEGLCSFISGGYSYISPFFSLTCSPLFSFPCGLGFVNYRLLIWNELLILERGNRYAICKFLCKFIAGHELV